MLFLASIAAFSARRRYDYSLGAHLEQKLAEDGNGRAILLDGGRRILICDLDRLANDF
jgi:hypothetical protein